jgi:hypothetical protein
MKHVLILSLLALPFTVHGRSAAQQKPAGENPAPVSLIQLIANPRRFDGKVVTTWGFLSTGPSIDAGTTIPSWLYLHEEDAKNLLTSNAVPVSPSRQMIKNQKELDRTYVELTGRVSLSPPGADFPAAVIKHVDNCTVWSDPRHPQGERTIVPWFMRQQQPRK